MSVTEFFNLFLGQTVNNIGESLSLLSFGSGFWVPIILIGGFLVMWKHYVNAHFISKMSWTTLEIKIPREIIKSPIAMELVLNAFNQSSKGKWPDQWWKGKLVPWASLEIASLEGHIHFFIYVQRFFVPLVESQIYAQFPEVEVIEVDDYTKYVNYGKPGSEWDLHGYEYELDKPDAYPIKTYIEYELEKDRKDQKQHIDPLVSLLELMGSIGKDQQIWMQIPVQTAQKRFLKKGKWFKKEDWTGPGKELIKELRKSDIAPKAGVVVNTNKLLSPGEEQLVKAIERGLSKQGYDCGLRIIYLAKRGAFQDIYKAALAGIVKQFNAIDRNGFKPNGDFNTDFDYPWQDFRGVRLSRRKRDIFKAYRLRSYFYPPYVRPPFTLSSEELATLFHFPGAAAETPSFARIPSKTAEPPANLPT
jgi:hypothetical protein